MSVKTTGAEFKQYYHDDQYWEKESWHDDHAIKVNGEYTEDICDDDIPDDAEVVIESGTVYIPVVTKGPGYAEDEVSLVKHFKNWRKQQKYTTLIVTVEKEHLDAVTSQIKTLPGVNSVK